MSKQNKVAVNLAQDFTDAEKAQARANIGAGTGDSNIMFSNVLGGADNSLANTQISVGRQNVPSTIDYYEMSVTNENSNTKTFALLPTDKDDGMVVMSNGHATTIPIPESGDSFDTVQQLLAYNASNTNKLDSIFIGNDYTEYAGNIGFTTTSSGNMSICAFDANEQLIYGSQCVNFSGPATGVTNFVPFTFKETGNDRISFIGIKGSANGNADITHLFYLGKK